MKVCVRILCVATILRRKEYNMATNEEWIKSIPIIIALHRITFITAGPIHFVCLSEL